MDEVETVARGLTKPQEEAIRVMQQGQQYGYGMLSGGVRARLFKKGILTYAGHRDGAPTMEFTDLGLAVRALLEKESRP